MNRFRIIALIFLAAIALQGCAVKKYAISSLGSAMAGGGDVYASDNDIELIAMASPFSLKTIEALIVEVPEHKGLLIAAAKGFTSYSYAFVDLKAFELEEADPGASRELKNRAKNMYLRGRGYALRAVELHRPGFLQELYKNPEEALSAFEKEHLPELYWLTVSWAAAIAADKMDMSLLADLNLIEILINRCMELDPEFEAGALHEFMIAYQGGRSELQGGGEKPARKHFEKALELSGRARISPWISLAENVSVRAQNRLEFEQLLAAVLEFDVDSSPTNRLANLIAQKRAKILLSRADNYFLEH
jgi:predicted anti-sigma-YlaC factor YlaD